MDEVPQTPGFPVDSLPWRTTRISPLRLWSLPVSRVPVGTGWCSDQDSPKACKQSAIDKFCNLCELRGLRSRFLSHQRTHHEVLGCHDDNKLSVTFVAERQEVLVARSPVVFPSHSSVAASPLRCRTFSADGKSCGAAPGVGRLVGTAMLLRGHRRPGQCLAPQLTYPMSSWEQGSHLPYTSTVWLRQRQSQQVIAALRTVGETPTAQWTVRARG